MTSEQGMVFIDSLASFAKPILVFSGGEPLFRRDIFELTCYAKSKGLTTALATNGTLIDQSMTDRIIRAGFEGLRLALMALVPRPTTNFVVFPGLLPVPWFVSLRNAGMSMQINCTLARHVVEKDKLYELALDLGADALHVFMLVPVGCGVEISPENQLPAEQYETILNWFYDRARESKLQTKATCAPHYYRIMRERAKGEGIKLSFETHGVDAVTRGCLAGSAVCFVSHKGEVFRCGYLPVIAGNVLRQPFSEIWEGSTVFGQLRDTEENAVFANTRMFVKAAEHVPLGKHRTTWLKNLTAPINP